MFFKNPKRKPRLRKQKVSPPTQFVRYKWRISIMKEIFILKHQQNLSKKTNCCTIL